MFDLKVLSFFKLKPVHILTDVLTYQDSCCRQGVFEVLDPLLKGDPLLLNNVLSQPVRQ